MGRLCQNVTRRNGVYWFTKKIRTPAGVRRVEFSLSVRQPELATMVAAQVSAQFHLLSHHVVSGQYHGNGLRLDRRGRGVTRIMDGAQNALVQAKFDKRGRCCGWRDDRFILARRMGVVAHVV